MTRLNSKQRKVIRERLWGRPSRNAICHYCGVGITRKTSTLDHKIPRIHGGKNGRDNLIMACKPCNQEKGSGDYEAFKAYKLPQKQARKNGLPIPELVPFVPVVVVRVRDPLKPTLIHMNKCRMVAHLRGIGRSWEDIADYYEVPVETVKVMHRVFSAPRLERVQAARDANLVELLT